MNSPRQVTLRLPEGIKDISIEDHGNGPSVLVYFENGTHLHIDMPGVHGPQIVVGHYRSDDDSYEPLGMGSFPPTDEGPQP